MCRLLGKIREIGRKIPKFTQGGKIMRGHSLLWQVAVVSMMVTLFGTVSVGNAKDKSGVLKASELIGMKVEGTDGKNLGKIRDLVIDPYDGEIDYAVLDFGGFLGIGDKY